MDSPPKPRRAASGSMSSDVTTTTRSFRSRRPPQQAHFPGRRRVVKTYGRRRLNRSPKQQTLTQLGSIMHPQLELEEIEDDDVAEPGSEGGEEVSKNTKDTKKTATKGSKKSTKSSSRNAVKKVQKRKTKTARHSAPSSSFHTQTLTQLASDVDKDIYIELSDSSPGETSNRGAETLRATLETTEKAVSSPSKTASKAASSPSKTTSPIPQIPHTPSKQSSGNRRETTTPRSIRSEIPSSQPSPFTPLPIFGRYHSPLNGQRSSPLLNKTQSSGGPDLGSSSLTPKDLADRPMRPATSRSVSQKRKRDDSLQAENNSSPATTPVRQRTPLRPLGQVEVWKRSSRQMSAVEGEKTKEIELESQPETPRGGTDVIPDSDEEQDDGQDDLRDEGALLGFTSPLRTIEDTDDETATEASLDDIVPATPTPKRTRLSDLSCPVDIEAEETESEYEVERGEEEEEEEEEKEEGKEDEKGEEKEGYNEDEKEEEKKTEEENETNKSPAETQHNFDTLEVPQETQHNFDTLESQRVSLDVIRSLAPQTDRSDIIISIHPEFVEQIVQGTKDHEFRSYKIPQTVSRFWIYVTRPVCELQYMAVVGSFQEPGEIDSTSGTGNADFNAGRMTSAKFAYKLEQVYQLNNPVTLARMKKNGWVDGPPQRYTYVPPAVVGALLANLRCALFADENDNENKDGEKDWSLQDPKSVSQEIEAQLLSDISERTDTGAETETERGEARVTRGEARVTRAEARVTRPETRTELRPETRTATTTATGTETERTTVKHTGTQELSLFSQATTASFASPSASALDSNNTRPKMPSASQELRMLSQKAQRQQRQLFSSSSADSTQLVLPDSLYEEVRQAPAVILDSEDEDE